MAHTLRVALAAMGFKITVSQSLELIAQAFGVADWNTLSAAMRPEATSVPEDASRPTPTDKSAKAPGPLSSQLESTLNQAFAYAKERKHEEVTVEHLLLFLLDDADASPVMKACGVDPGALRSELTNYIDNNLKSHPTGGADGTPEAIGLPSPNPTLGFQRVLQRAVFHAKTSGSFPMTGATVLTAIFSEKDSRAVQLLNEQGMTRLDAVNFITHGLTKGGDAAESPAPT
jgi:ATP-dependent Clp protease ATP-binding subunit ClpA